MGGHQFHGDTSQNTAGIGPWKVAMLSAVLMLWDVMWWAHVPMNSQDWIIKVCGALTYHMFMQVLLSYFIRSIDSCHQHIMHSLFICAAEVDHVTRAFVLLGNFHRIRPLSQCVAYVHPFICSMRAFMCNSLQCRSVVA